MKRLLIVATVVSLVGCATPQQNAALTGAIVGAAIMSAAAAPYHQPQPRPLYCSARFIGYDYYHRPMYQQICR